MPADLLAALRQSAARRSTRTSRSARSSRASSPVAGAGGASSRRRDASLTRRSSSSRQSLDGGASGSDVEGGSRTQQPQSQQQPLEEPRLPLPTESSDFEAELAPVMAKTVSHGPKDRGNNNARTNAIRRVMSSMGGGNNNTAAAAAAASATAAPGNYANTAMPPTPTPLPAAGPQPSAYGSLKPSRSARDAAAVDDGAVSLAGMRLFASGRKARSGEEHAAAAAAVATRAAATGPRGSRDLSRSRSKNSSSGNINSNVVDERDEDGVELRRDLSRSRSKNSTRKGGDERDDDDSVDLRRTRRNRSQGQSSVPRSRSHSRSSRRDDMYYDTEEEQAEEDAFVAKEVENAAREFYRRRHHHHQQKQQSRSSSRSRSVSRSRGDNNGSSLSRNGSIDYDRTRREHYHGNSSNNNDDSFDDDELLDQQEHDEPQQQQRYGSRRREQARRALGPEESFDDAEFAPPPIKTRSSSGRGGSNARLTRDASPTPPPPMGYPSVVARANSARRAAAAKQKLQKQQEALNGGRSPTRVTRVSSRSSSRRSARDEEALEDDLDFEDDLAEEDDLRPDDLASLVASSKGSGSGSASSSTSSVRPSAFGAAVEGLNGGAVDNADVFSVLPAEVVTSYLREQASRSGGAGRSQRDSEPAFIRPLMNARQTRSLVAACGALGKDPSSEHFANRTKSIAFVLSIGGQWFQVNQDYFNQAMEYNDFSGGYKRFYDELPRAFIRSRVAQRLLTSFQAVYGIPEGELVLVQVQSSNISPEDAGKCLTGQGIHSDGADRAMLVCLERENVTGARTSVFHDPEGNRPIVDQHTLQEGHCLFWKDNEIYHYVEPAGLEDASKGGRRTVMIAHYPAMHYITGKTNENNQLAPSGHHPKNVEVKN